jgi:fluoroacetyl-CoA thioesterase
MAGQQPGRNAQIVDRGVNGGAIQQSYSWHQKWPLAHKGITDEADMDARDYVTIGMTAEKTVTVTSEMTVGHFVANMPQVYATPMMILHMEMASGSAIASHLPEGFVSVGMDVKVRHLAATPVGRSVRAISRVIKLDPKSVVFEVEAWDRDRKIGDGTHRRGIVNVLEFEKRFGVKQLAMSSD